MTFGARSLPLAGGLAMLALLSLMPGCSAAQDRDPLLERLQGSWRGEGEVSIWIDGNNLIYEGGHGRYESTFMLPPGSDPQQLHATITKGNESHVGGVVKTIVESDGQELTLGMDDAGKVAPGTWDDAVVLIVVRKTTATSPN